jgi:hypothetical protein
MKPDHNPRQLMASPRTHHEQYIQDEALQTARTVREHGGRFATIISALALLFSGYSFYEAVLRAPELAVYVPPRIAFSDPDSPTSPFEVFVIPVTLANDGARTGTVLSMDLTVKNTKTGNTKKFYSAQVGPWGASPVKAFAPVSLPGRVSNSQAVQFFPIAEEKLPRITSQEGAVYEFEIRLNTASKSTGIEFLDLRTKPIKFTMEMGKMDYRLFTRTGTIELWSKGNKPVGSNSQ